MNRLTFSSVLFAYLLVVTISLPVSAATSALTPIGNIKAGLSASANTAGISTTNTDLSALLGQAINFTFGLIGSVFLILMIVGGVGWMTAGGNEEKVGRGKKFITSGVGGMLIIFMAYALVYLIIKALQLGATGTGA